MELMSVLHYFMWAMYLLHYFMFLDRYLEIQGNCEMGSYFVLLLDMFRNLKCEWGGTMAAKYRDERVEGGFPRGGDGGRRYI